MSVVSQSTRAIYTKKSCTASHWIYDSADAVGNAAGWEEGRADSIAVQYRVATKIPAAGTKVFFRVEGKFDTLDRPASIFMAEATAKHNIDKIQVINERVRYLRLGIKTSKLVASPTGSKCIVYGGFCLTEYK